MKTYILFALLACGGTYLGAAEPSLVLPRSDSGVQGIPSSAILAFVEAADKDVDSMNSFMLVRHGHVVAEGWWAPYDADTPHSLYSLSKSFTSTAVGLAVAEGKLSVDDEVLKFFPDDAPAEPSKNLKAMRVSDLLRMSTGHQTEPPRTPRSALDQDLPRAARAVQAGHPFPLQHVGDVHALGHRPEGDGHDRARLPEAAPFRAAGHRAPDLGNQPARRHDRRLRAEHPHRGHRQLRPALPAEGPMERQAAGARGLGRGGHRAPDLERQQPEERLGPRLRLPVLALPPRRLPRRRGVRAVLHRAARAGRRDRHHQRREGHAGGPEPGLGQAPPGHEAGAAGRR